MTTLATKLGLTVSVTVLETPPNVAFMATVCEELTSRCLTVNVALVSSLVTTTEDGTVAADGFELMRSTV
jgi:hypothetical protein